jgi:hypothetical protein
MRFLILILILAVSGDLFSQNKSLTGTWKLDSIKTKVSGLKKIHSDTLIFDNNGVLNRKIQWNQSTLNDRYKIGIFPIEPTSDTCNNIFRWNYCLNKNRIKLNKYKVINCCYIKCRSFYRIKEMGTIDFRNDYLIIDDGDFEWYYQLVN